MKLSKIQTLIDYKCMYKLYCTCVCTRNEKRIFKVKLVAWVLTKENDVKYDKLFSFVANYVRIWQVCSLDVIFSVVMNQIDVIATFFYVSVEK